MKLRFSDAAADDARAIAIAWPAAAIRLDAYDADAGATRRLFRGEQMGAARKGVPEDSSVVIPRLVCRDPAGAIAFCASVFDAIELGRRPGPDGAVAQSGAGSCSTPVAPSSRP